MIKVYGSGREWQRQMTHHWAKTMVEHHQNKALIIFEGQVDLAFIVEAFAAIKFNQYKIVLVHCDKPTRHQRLHIGRNQPELINNQMDNWAQYLYKQAIDMDVIILDTSNSNMQELIAWCKQNFF